MDDKQGDHARGCEGRQYTCTCGYDDRIATALEAQAAEIARLRNGYMDAVGGLQYILTHHGRLSGVGFDRVFNTYRALTGSQP